MRVQHNIPAMNSYRNYNNNSSSINKNLEKLSSGYKINRAGDDAAGLAISEKMRAQITGLEVAQKNAKNGISLVQTAEGALTEIHDMLNRMYNLAEQSANGTYAEGDKGIDRDQLNKEVEKLRTEIDRIATTVNFNGTNLLDGTLGGADGASGLSGEVDSSSDYANAAISNFAWADDVSEDVKTRAANDASAATDAGLNGGQLTITTSATGVSSIDAMGDFTFAVDGTDNTKINITFNSSVIGSFNFDLGTATLTADDQAIINLTMSNGSGGVSTDTDNAGTTAMGNGDQKVTTFSINGGLVLWIGAEADESNALSVSIESVKSDDLAITDSTVKIDTQEGALNSLQYIQAAINKVSDIRGTLGATQNRLEHTINNLSVMQENMQDAESTIRDTDVAEEMMKYTKNSILVQSAQAMLAQANQLPQGVLQLLQ